MIPKQNMDRLFSRLLKERRAVLPPILERDYVQAWILVGVGNSGLKERLAFKGGTALKKIYIPEYRFSADLDFTYINSEQREEVLPSLKKEFESLYVYLEKEANLRCISNPDRDEKGEESFTFYINYSGPLGSSIHKRDIKINITFGEVIVCGIQEKPILRNYEEYSDLPTSAKLLVYTVEEIFVEKLCCILDSARHEPRDIYDLWHLVNEGIVEPESIRGEFPRKAEHKKLKILDFGEVLERKEKTYKKLWEVSLKSQVPGGSIPYFNKVYRDIQRVFKTIV